MKGGWNVRGSLRIFLKLGFDGDVISFIPFLILKERNNCLVVLYPIPSRNFSFFILVEVLKSLWSRSSMVHKILVCCCFWYHCGIVEETIFGPVADLKVIDGRLGILSGTGK